MNNKSYLEAKDIIFQIDNKFDKKILEFKFKNTISRIFFTVAVFCIICFLRRVLSSETISLLKYLSISTLILYFLTEYTYNYSTEDKIHVKNIITFTLKENNIDINSDNLDILIKQAHIFKYEDFELNKYKKTLLKIIKNIKNTIVYSASKGLFFSLIGIFVGFVSFQINKEGLENFNNNIYIFFLLYTQIMVFIIIIYDFFLFIAASNIKKINIINEVLEDLKLKVNNNHTSLNRLSFYCCCKYKKNKYSLRSARIIKRKNRELKTKHKGLK
ncbi:hypothetical protein [Anaerococcus vaginalis]|uniref:hypothetical protein n=1 Tax=Anaerococcus vaginalis TaxID=33037 RepID=UPI00189A0400|nr:hypothetical protein [Anaerococcus vaginalis]